MKIKKRNGGDSDNKHAVRGSVKLTKSDRDPLGINGRLYQQCGELLSRLEKDEDISLRDHIAAVLAVGRLQTIFMGLRREKGNDSEAGAKVRQYADAFSAQKKDSNEPEPEEQLESDVIKEALAGYDDDADADADEQ